LLCSQLFDVLKRTNPDNLKKIVPLLGDCKELGLGMSPTDRQMIEEKVSVVFHCAATVRFDETLKNSVILNVRSTREVMLLARNMRELKVCRITFNKYNGRDGLIFLLLVCTRAGRPRGRSSSPGGGKNFCFSMLSRPTLGPTQYTGGSFPGGKAAGS
jgi:hypothetical protein